MNAPLAVAVASALCAVLDRRAFAAAVARLKHVVPRKSPTALGEAMHLSATQDAVALTARDGDLIVRASVPASVSRAGELVVSASALAQVARRASGRVVLDGATLTLGAVTHQLNALPSESYPLAPSPRGATLAVFHRASFMRLLNATRYAISTDATRPHLSALHFEREHDVLTVVATDGHRLVAATVSDTGAPFELLVSRRVVDELARWLDEPGGPITLRRDGERVYFVSGDAWVSGLAVDGRFPAWRQVVPQSSQGSITVPKTVFADAVKDVAGRTGRGVQLVPDPERRRVRIERHDPEGIVASTHVDALMHGKTPTRIGVEAKFLTELFDALPGIDLTVKLEVSGELDPVKVQTSSGVVAVVMPMRV